MVRAASPLSRRAVLLRALATVPSLFVVRCASSRGPLSEPVPLGTQPSSNGGVVTARFLGTTSLLFDDGEHTILSDGFVSRPGVLNVVFGEIAPDEKRIDEVLTQLDVHKIDAIFIGHTHYDHALDAAAIARRTGARLLGSESMRQLALGDLNESRIDVVHPGDTRRFGKFELTFVESRHSTPVLWPGRIRTPFKPPAPAHMWRAGEVWSVLVRHEQRSLLVHGSANYKRGALNRHRADVVYLGVGALAARSDRFLRNYWNAVVRATRAKRVILVHWDVFFGTGELRAGAGFDRTTERIQRLADEATPKVEVLLPVLWEPTDPFAGLP
jgi:L-ascorbate metabolism protein UlaG (beta-lactamase superfamily)